jgi:hypothetical protein
MKVFCNRILVCTAIAAINNFETMLIMLYTVKYTHCKFSIVNDNKHRPGLKFLVRETPSLEETESLT